jgi:hypothetical protein
MLRIGRLLLMVGVLTWLAVPAQAQNPWARRPPQMPDVPVDRTGTIEAVNGPMIQVTTDDNQTLVLSVRPTTKVKVTGKGKASSLVKGQTVSFSASGSGKMEKISTLAVVLPSGQMGPGPAANPAPGPKPGSKLGKNPGGAEADAGGSSDGTGVVSRVTKSMVFLSVNGKKARGYELPDDVEVTFDLDGPAALEFVPPGAKIEFKGTAKSNPPRVELAEVKVEVVPVEGRSGKHALHKAPKVKPKKGGDDKLDAAGADGDKPEPKKPRHPRKKADADDEKPADEKPADEKATDEKATGGSKPAADPFGGTAPAKDK